jgi:hypothetical protein
VKPCRAMHWRDYPNKTGRYPVIRSRRDKPASAQQHELLQRFGHPTAHRDITSRQAYRIIRRIQKHWAGTVESPTTTG